jgi:TRAP-type C4-dicarboxylate transport system permease small subunit
MIDKKATKWLKIFGYIVITFFVAIIIFVGTRTIRSSSDSRKVKESERSVVGSPQIGFSSREEFNSK